MDSRRLILSSIALAALLWSTGEVQAQCTGQPGANQVCAGPASGGPGLPNFRAAVTADLPSTVGTVKSVAATVPASFLTLTGSPITASGTLAFGLVTTLADSYWCFRSVMVQVRLSSTHLAQVLFAQRSEVLAAGILAGRTVRYNTITQVCSVA
jgi:hypothetical protein